MAAPSPTDAVDAAKAAAEKMEKDIESLEVQKKITETYAQQLKQVQELRELERASGILDAAKMNKLKEQLELQKVRLQMSIEEADVESDMLENLRLQFEQMESIGESHDIDLDKIKEQRAEMEKLVELYEEAKEAKEDELTSSEGIVSLAEKGLKMGLRFLGQSEKKIEQYSQIANYLEKLGEDGTSFVDIAKKGSDMWKKNAIEIKALGQKLGKLKHIAAAAGLIAWAAELTAAVSGASRALGSATGMGYQFGGELLDIYDNTLLMGGSIEDAGEAMGALATNFSKFDPAAHGVNVTLATTVVRLKKIGIDTATSAKSMDFFTRTMGVSAEVAADMTVEIAMMGRQMGTTSSKMMADWESASGYLAIYGSRNVQVFKGLAAQAKASGMEVSSLIGISQQYNQFDTAADSVAKLNAVLGTQLSTIEMMSANDADRITMLRQQIGLQVGNFDNLDKFTKMYIAQAMGVKDVGEAQKLLNMDQEEYLKYMGDMEEANKSQEDLAAITAELVPLWTQFKAAFLKALMLFKPVIKLWIFVMEVIGAGVAYVAAGFEKLEPFYSSLLKAFVAIGIAVKAGFVLFAWWSAGAALVATPVGWVVAGVMALVSAIYWFRDAWNAKSSLSVGEIVMGMAGWFAAIPTAIFGVARAFKTLMTAFRPLAEAFNRFIQPFASLTNLDTTALVSGLGAVKSILVEMAGTELDGFIAIRSEGGATSLVMGDEDIAANISGGKITVDVNVPELKMPEVNVKVYLDSRELKSAFAALQKDVG